MVDELAHDLVGRVFVAAPLPPEIRFALAERVSSMAIPGKVGPSQNWHVTLRFLDTIDQVTYERFLFGLESIGQMFSFPISLRDFGAFPNGRKATVFWAGIGRGASDTSLLNEVAEEAAVAAGLSPEERPFHPHLTLSRIRPPADVRDLLDEELDLGWRCDHVVIYRSHLGRGRATYEPLDSVRLIG
ncbi:MAG TPA: RNA 2',3'-cyclic phosphodiesterase [Acidimicrobiia bacterium]|nr:RNA 2',3'-cyclic phosphodiesterase [Acidimicrobiia bacterium]